MREDNRKRAAWRENQRQMEAVVDGSYRCFLPQERVKGGGVGDMVVFSLMIAKNNEANKIILPDGVVSVADDSVTLRMSSSPSDFQDLRGDKQGLRSREADRRERITTLVYNAISQSNTSGRRSLARADYTVHILGGGGSGSGGPTGIACAVVSKGFGGQLAYAVGAALEAKAEGRGFAPPVINKGKSN